MTPDQVWRPVRRRRELHRRDDRRGPRRTLAARRSRSTWPDRTWSGTSTSSPSASGADLWWIIYVALRDLLLVQVFLGSFIFFYPDVVSGKELPITGGLAAVCAFAVLLIKLIKGDGDLNWFRIQVMLLGLGAALYIVPVLPRRPGDPDRDGHLEPARLDPREQREPGRRPDPVLPVGRPGRDPRRGRGRLQLPRGQRPAADEPDQGADPMSADDLATALTTGGSGWLVLSLAAVLPILWAFALIMHFARPYVLRFLQTLTLRFGGDVWWLSYVLVRDVLLLLTLALSDHRS